MGGRGRAQVGKIVLRGRESSVNDIQNDTLPHSSASSLRTYAAILADELSKAADKINWPRPESEGMDDHIAFAGYYGMDEPMDASATEGAHLPYVLADRKPG